MLIPLSLLLQQAITQGPAPVQATTPPTRDTTGYWQQRASYRIEARLDERAQRLEARGTLRYVNASPDTLRELYLHQYLNAFRPGSQWSRDDAREGRVRFQALQDPAYGYERFTEDPRIGGVAVRAEYPLAPDSTLVRLALPRPLAPGDSIEVEMAWQARPSTTPRRQGRRGRQWDFAHWYPKPAVYDRGGWEPNALRPAGEFYSEFGDYDVTIRMAADQVLGTTGVVVQGDPGWERARRWGETVMQPGAYGATATADAPAPGTEKTVRVVARDVHTFAWSVSPDYRYEGGTYVRAAATGAAPMRFPTWDTVAVHVLYRPGDERDWGQGQVVQRTRNTLAWLERIYGPYAYPQMTVLHRLDGGGTEFPMVQMNGSASQGLNLHEGGHIYTYGILASNEWRSGWMDEGLTSYQSSWAQGLTRITDARRDSGVPLPVQVRPPARRTGYAGLALRPVDGPDVESLAQWRYAVQGIAQPIGTRADRFRDFGTYNSMIYSRAEMMYGALHDALGDSAFVAFLRDYYARWGLRHVDEVAMRASAERAAGRDMGWFFDQWVHDVGLVDYHLGRVTTTREGSEWVTRARIYRRGAYRHPMPVGARTSSGWTIARGDALRDRQTVEIRTAEKPAEVRLDPLRTTEDWYRPNDERVGWWFFKSPRGPKHVVDWPLLDQASADRVVAAWSPLAWHSSGPGVAVGVRMRSSYRGLVDRDEVGYATYLEKAGPLRRCRMFGLECADEGLGTRMQWYWSIENPRGGRRPLMGFRAAYAELDGMQFAELRQRVERKPFAFAPSGSESMDFRLRFTRPFADGFLDPSRWYAVDVLDASVAYTAQQPPAPAGRWRRTIRAELSGGVQGEAEADPGLSGEVFGIVQLESSWLRRATGDASTSFARVWVGFSSGAPVQRLPALGARSATDLFLNHWVRPQGGVLSADDVPFVVPGGAAMRGYRPYLAIDQAAALNLEQAHRLRSFGTARRLGLFGTVFANGLVPLEDLVTADGETLLEGGLAEGGVGLALRGALFDRDVRLRVDVPVWLSEPRLAIAGRETGRPLGLRVSFAASDLW